MTRPSTANGGFPNVVVTAVTATTSIAPDIESTWKGLLAGESGIRVLEDEFVDQMGPAGARSVGTSRSPSIDHDEPAGHATHVVRPADGQAARRPALGDRGHARGRSRTASRSSIGTGLGGGEKIVETYDAMNEGGPRKVSPLAVQMIMPNGAAAVVGLRARAPAPGSSPRCRRARRARRPSPTRGARSSWVTPTSPSAAASRAASRRCRSRRSR